MRPAPSDGAFLSEKYTARSEARIPQHEVWSVHLKHYYHTMECALGNQWLAKGFIFRELFSIYILYKKTSSMRWVTSEPGRWLDLPLEYRIELYWNFRGTWAVRISVTGLPL
jgi:hypothetical protein